MMSMRRPLACVAVLAALTVSALAQDLSGTFREGVELLQRGRDEEALAKFQACLAMEPDSAQAYELFKTTDAQVWSDLLNKGGQLELVGKRLMELVRTGRKEHKNDAEAISALIERVDGDDVADRMRAIHTLSADHGEYAVPPLLYALGDQDNDDRRIVHIQALTKLGADSVLPLVAALQSEDPFMRRNVALTLGYIADPRAAGFLGASAATDPDQGAAEAAAEAAKKSGGSNALADLLKLGNGWHAADPTVLRPQQVSDVVWRWDGQMVVPISVPPFLYHEELAKSAFYAALKLQPSSNEALAGVARASAAEHGELAARAGTGDDVAAWQERLMADDLALQVAGSEALDVALLFALQSGDDVAASGLCRALAAAATAPTQGLETALRSRTSGAVRGEAAVALANIAHRSGRPAAPGVVEALAEAAGRDVLRLVAIIDADDNRRLTLEQALRDEGVSAHSWTTGARGLNALRRVSGVDALLVAETLPDLTFAQVVDEVKSDPAHAQTPVIVLAADAAAATELWGDRVSEAVVGVEDLPKINAALEGSMNRDREEASRLAQAAAEALAALAGAGHTDFSEAADSLAASLAGKPDPVVVPLLAALGSAGGVGQTAPITAVLSDAERSEAARQAAAMALAGIFSRSPQAADEASVTALHTVATSDAAFPVRQAAATALGRLRLDPAMRAQLVESLRANLATTGAAGAAGDGG